MAGGKRLFAAAPLVVVKDVAGVDHYVYEGQPLTAMVPDERRKQLLAEGKLVEVETLAVAVPVEADDTVLAERPAKNTKVEAWRAYAQSIGFSEVDLEGLKKPDLIEAVIAAEEDDSSDGGDSADSGDGVTGADESGDPDAPTIT
ncbi:hypothetical protein [Janibacter sp. GS2]|uniref:hypothetical protein n=1 Tax=Janibacter sp. GS2 TaxID=3442646 RepID=UPI003EBA9C13